MSSLRCFSSAWPHFPGNWLDAGSKENVRQLEEGDFAVSSQSIHLSMSTLHPWGRSPGQCNTYYLLTVAWSMILVELCLLSYLWKPILFTLEGGGVKNNYETQNKFILLKIDFKDGEKYDFAPSNSLINNNLDKLCAFESKGKNLKW